MPVAQGESGGAPRCGVTPDRATIIRMRRLVRADAPLIGFVVAAVAGSLHGIASIYWGVGGNALIGTVGSIADQFADRRWILVIVGLAKLAAALIPAVVAVRGTRLGLLRPVCWVGATALVTWGAVNTLTGSLLALGVLPRPARYDATGTIGHAALWSPLFLAWGVALGAALWLSRSDGAGRSFRGRPFRSELIGKKVQSRFGSAAG